MVDIKINILRCTVSKILKFMLYCYIVGYNSSVGIATDYGLDGPGSNPDADKTFRASKPALWPTQPNVKWVPCLSPVVEAVGAWG